MASHSPAPWSARKNTPDGQGGTWTVEDADGVALALVFDVGDATETNAVLIAAAVESATS